MEQVHHQLKAHVARLAICSIASLGYGVEALVNMRGEWNRGFGSLTLGWAVVNLIICLASHLGKKPDNLSKLREFLFLNLGLNVAYIGVGITMALLGTAGVAGAGVAVAIQGGILLVLDIWLLRKISVPEHRPENRGTSPT